MIASACLTLAGMHLLVWLRQRDAWGNLLFALLATATSVLAACELWMMGVETPEQFGTALRWLHVPAWVVVVALVGFVRVYLRAGRPWLAWTIGGLRTLSLILDFVFTPNLNYREITALRHIPLLGESVSVAEGIPNPWMLIGQLSLLLLVIFVADASVAVWRRGGRRQALTVGGSIMFFAAVGTAQAVLVLWGIVLMPITASLPFLGVVAAMGYELSQDVLRAAQFGRELQESERRLALTASMGITARQQAEERFRLAVEASPNGIALVNGEGRMVLVNAETERLFGYTREELIGHAVEMLVPERLRGGHPGERAGFFAEPHARAMGAGRELFARRKDGTEFPIEVGLNPIRSAEGLLVLTAIVDITERKRTELELVRQRSELAHLSRVTMLGELSGSMAHELNQPLTAILSNAQAAQRFLAHDHVDLNELRDILTDIVDQDNRAGEVIHRLRLLLTKGEVQQQWLDLNDVVQEVLKLIRGDLTNQGVTVLTRLAPALPAVSGDRVQLQQVLLNLVMNGSDAMHSNPPADRRMVVRTELADGGVRVSVSDRGTGIALETLEQVFEPFFTTKTHGLGLGLSVCRTIVTAHGGGLRAANNPEGGATFHFTLPVSASTSSTGR